MVKNHYFKERKKAKKERKPVGQPVGAKVQGWPTNPKTKILNKSGKKQSGRWATCPGLAVCLVQALRGDRLTWLSFLFWQIGNLKEQFVEAGGLRQVSPGRGAKRNKRGDSCRGVQPGFGVKPSEKATGFVRGSERIKEAVSRG